MNDTDNHIDDSENLYRSIHPSMCKNINGKLEISAAAFNDAKEEPSVDRAKLRNNKPALAKRSENAGVISLNASNIREICFEETETSYTLDVKADPSTTNKSHAVIIGKPSYKNKNGFRMAKEKLAHLAANSGWEIEPTEPK